MRAVIREMKRLLIASLFCLLLCACKTIEKPSHLAVTASAQTSVTRAATASHEAQAASERSSVHIRAFKTDAERIDYKAGRALRILDHP
jgi:curli biogenesis system outer membrane secretion channel CsgG